MFSLHIMYGMSKTILYWLRQQHLLMYCCALNFKYTNVILPFMMKIKGFDLYSILASDFIKRRLPFISHKVISMYTCDANITRPNIIICMYYAVSITNWFTEHVQYYCQNWFFISIVAHVSTCKPSAPSTPKIASSESGKARSPPSCVLFFVIMSAYARPSSPYVNRMGNGTFRVVHFIQNWYKIFGKTVV